MKMHDLHLLCVTQLCKFNTAPMTEKAHLLAMAIETAVEAEQVKQRENDALSQAVYGYLYNRVNIGQWCNECKAALDSHSALSPGEQMHFLMTACIENYIWANLGADIAQAIAVDYKQVAFIILAKWGY